MIPRVVGEFSYEERGALGETDGNIGAEIWQRFTLTLDYKSKRVFSFQTTALTNPSPRLASAGRSILLQANTTSCRFFPGSPASEAGIVVGDNIVAINGKPVAEIGNDDVLSKAVGATIRVKLRDKDGVEREVTLTLRDLI